MGFGWFHRAEIASLQGRGAGACCSETAIAVEHELRRVGAFGVADRFTAPGGDRATQHLLERRRIGQVRPVRPGSDVEQDQCARPARVGRDQRAAIGEAGPRLAGKIRRGLGEHLLANAHVRWDRQAGKGRCRGEGRHGLRFIPGEGAAQRAGGSAQCDG